MRIVYMGTPDFAVPSLRALVKHGYDVVGVFTQPDRPAGRGKKLKPSPVKVVAEELGLAVFQPPKIKTPEAIQQLRALAPDLIIVVAYGQILSKEILQLPTKGCINVHASLLPSYRGAAPIHWAIMKGENRTGVTTMLMDEGLDTGDILLKREVAISNETTTGELHDQLAVLGGELLIDTLYELEMGWLIATPQTGESNYAPLLKREHECINWTRKAAELHNQIRGLNPWPGAFTSFRGENLKIWRSTLWPQTEEYLNTGDQNSQSPIIDQEPGTLNYEPAVKSTAKPGQIIQVLEKGLLVQTGDGVLLILEVQPAGKRAMPARDFFNGRHGQVGEKFA
ncbi:MAG: methionyl-tRNA formyltransferase [Desulfosporosinus sp.]|jgi:methionyl-tRNA formyltransferase